jgi:type VI secretion system secreted protein VgrG
MDARVGLTHPQQLVRAGYLNHDGAFSITADDGIVQKFKEIV